MTAPTTSISTTFSKIVLIPLPTFKDDEGHIVTLIYSIPSSTPYITYESSTN